MQKEEIIDYLKENKNLLKSGTDGYINLVEEFFEKCEDRGMECPLLDVPEEELIEHLEDLYFMNLTAQIMMRKGINLFCKIGKGVLEYRYPYLDHLLELVQVGSMDEEKRGYYSMDRISRDEFEAKKSSRDYNMLLFHLLDLKLRNN